MIMQKIKLSAWDSIEDFDSKAMGQKIEFLDISLNFPSSNQLETHSYQIANKYLNLTSPDLVSVIKL